MTTDTVRLVLKVSRARAEEWRELIRSMPATTDNPVSGDRVMVLARAGLAEQIRYKRRHREKAEAKRAQADQAEGHWRDERDRP